MVFVFFFNHLNSFNGDDDLGDYELHLAVPETGVHQMRIIERHFTGEHGNSGISPMWFPANKSSSKPPSQWFFPSLSPKGRSNIGLPALSHSQTNPRGMLSWGGNELHVVNGSVHGKGIYTARISNPQQRAQLNGSTAQLDGGMEFQFFHFFSNPIGSR